MKWFGSAIHGAGHSVRWLLCIAARTLGLQQELEIGIYTCCQISAWADEQWLAWFEATQEDSRLVDNMTGRPQFDDSDIEGVLVPIRLRQRQVPWYRHS